MRVVAAAGERLCGASHKPMPPQPSEDRIAVHLDRLLERRAMTLSQLAERVGVTVVNLSILENGRARAIRFSTLAALCEALDCQPGDLLSHEPDGGAPSTPGARSRA